MEESRRKGSRALRTAFVALLAAAVSGCALGTTRLVVEHDPVAKVEKRREGALLVHKFTDKREVKDYIGNKRNAFGGVVGHIGVAEGVDLEDLLTRYFADAVREAGYQVTVAPTAPAGAKFDAVVDGDILTFWMDLYMAVWHDVRLHLKASDMDTGRVFWEKDIEGSERRVLWVGATGEYERIVREALSIALNRAAQEFASDEFAEALRRKGGGG